MLAANKVKSLVATIATAACVAFFPVAQAGQSGNSRPTISGAPPQTANVGAAYRFRPAASDADGDALRFSIANRPAWALRWTPPTHNIDGTPVVGLSGYQVSYGTVSRSYSHALPIAGASTTSVTIEGLVPAIWYFAVKAAVAAGVVSDFSKEASKTP